MTANGSRVMVGKVDHFGVIDARRSVMILHCQFRSPSFVHDLVVSLGAKVSRSSRILTGFVAALATVRSGTVR